MIITKELKNIAKKADYFFIHVDNKHETTHYYSTIATLLLYAYKNNKCIGTFNIFESVGYNNSARHIIFTR